MWQPFYENPISLSLLHKNFRMMEDCLLKSDLYKLIFVKFFSTLFTINVFYKQPSC